MFCGFQEITGCRSNNHTESFEFEKYFFTEKAWRLQVLKMAEDIRYEGTSMLNEEGEYLFNRKKTSQKLNTTQLLLIGIIVVGCAIFYIELNRKTVEDIGYSK